MSYGIRDVLYDKQLTELHLQNCQSLLLVRFIFTWAATDIPALTDIQLLCVVLQEEIEEMQWAGDITSQPLPPPVKLLADAFPFSPVPFPPELSQLPIHLIMSSLCRATKK